MEKTKTKKPRLFPADEIGIPLSIYVPETYRDPEGKLDKNIATLDKHHRFAPRKDLIHHASDISRVLRYSCYQMVPKVLHKEFNKHYDKPSIPYSIHKKFGLLLLSVARYLPAEAIDVRGDYPVERELTLQERHLIWGNNELKPEQSPKIQREILNYVADRDIAGVDESLVEEFLTTTNDNVRVQRGMKLFRIASEIAVAPIEQAYKDAWEGQLLPRHDFRPEPRKLVDLSQIRAVPKRPAKFVLRHVVKDSYALQRTLNSLQSNLEARYAA